MFCKAALITANKNTIPDDPEKFYITSGLRIGTPAITSRGMGVPEMIRIGKCIADVLKHPDDEAVARAHPQCGTRVVQKIPLYPHLREVW